jgi:hypothetical protein
LRVAPLAGTGARAGCRALRGSTAGLDLAMAKGPCNGRTTHRTVRLVGGAPLDR